MSNANVEKGTTRQVDILVADKVSTDRVSLVPQAADPSDAANGDIWYVAGEVNKVRGKVNGALVTFTVVADA